MMPVEPSVWPLQRDLIAFYGDPRIPGWLAGNTTFVVCPWPLNMGTIPITHILIHQKCADSLTRVLNATWNAVGEDRDKIILYRYNRFSGSYAPRPMRGGSAMSVHWFAAAVDFDDADNEQHHLQHLFLDTSPLVQAFKNEGWVWGGDWSPASVDAMHFQAARVY
jgi:hypothetical protein